MIACVGIFKSISAPEIKKYFSLDLFCVVFFLITGRSC